MKLVQITAERYKRIYFFNDDDIVLLQEAGAKIKAEKDNVFSEYYAWMTYQSEYQESFTDDVINLFERYEEAIWIDYTEARFNDETITLQQELCEELLNMGVPFEGYLSSLLAFQEIIENAFDRSDLGSFEIIRAFKKMAGIGLFVAIDTNNNKINKTIKEQNEALMEMSTPVTQVWKGILFLPLVGIVDSKRAQDVMTAMLQKIADSQAKVFILDISGIAVVDTAVANYLIKITKATQLMGCTCIISGISGAVAQTIVELGIQIDEVETTGNMQDAIEKAFRVTGVKIVSLSDLT